MYAQISVSVAGCFHYLIGKAAITLRQASQKKKKKKYKCKFHPRLTFYFQSVLLADNCRMKNYNKKQLKLQ